jgi:hypothetical protein
MWRRDPAPKEKYHAEDWHSHSGDGSGSCDCLGAAREHSK